MTQSFSSKLIKFFVLFTSSIFFVSWSWAEHKIAIIVPMEHQAMDDIVAGIQEGLPKVEYSFTVHHAHGDLNILTNILNQIQYQKPDAVVAIGTTTSQMTLSQLPPNMVVVCAATSIKPPRDLVYVVDDTADVSDLIKRLPQVQVLGICCSAQDKSIREIQELKQSLQGTGIQLEERIVHTMQDIPSAVQSFSSKTQAIMLFKDHLTVSALPIFIQECKSRQIPLLASDEASVRKGATLSYGVEEKQIGILTAQILNNYFSDIDQPIVSTLTPFAKLYVNKTALKQQKIWNAEDLRHLGWSIVELE